MSRGDLPDAWPVGPGEMASLVCAKNWVKTPLGTCHSWPQGLRSALDLMLPAQAAMALVRGPDKLVFYNDACASFIGSQHLQALGQPGSACLSERWGTLEPLLMAAWNSGQSFLAQNRPFLISRQEPWTTACFNIFLFTVHDAANVLCIMKKTTQCLLNAQVLVGKDAALHTEQEFARLLLDFTSERFHAVDREYVTLLCSAACLKMRAYGSADEVPERKLCSSIAPPQVDSALVSAAACLLQLAVLAGKSIGVTKAIFYRKDETHFSVDYCVALIWRMGLLDGAICTFSNTSERLLGQQIKQAREKAESDLRETHGQLRLAGVAGGIGTFLLEIKTDYLTVSDKFFGLFGFSVSRSLPASRIESAFLRESADAIFSEASRQSGKAVQNVEYRLKKADTGEVDWVNQKVSDYSGLDEKNFLKDGWVWLIQPCDWQRVAAEWQHSPQHKTRYETELCLRGHNGICRWRLVHALPIVQEGATRWLGANTDIGEQKAAQAELAQLNATLEDCIRQRTGDCDYRWRLSPDLVLVAGFDGIIKSVNRGWKKLLGWDESELVGQRLTQLVHQNDPQRTAAELQRLGTGRTTQRFENRYRHTDDSHKTISWITVPDSQRIHAADCDISVERESALALQEVEQRLRQSQKMQVTGPLTGGIAHDFNSVLQGISGSIELTRARLASGRGDDIEHFMDSTAHSARRAAALVHRLLAFVRRQSPESKTADINRLTVSMNELMRRTLSQHLERVAPGKDTWWVCSDDNPLKGALLRLARNFWCPTWR